MSKARFFIGLFLLGTVVMALACGKKGPPLLPDKRISSHVVDLRGEWAEGYVSLKGKINAPEGARTPLEGCRVYYGQYSLADAPCAGCPVNYSGYHGFGPEVISGDVLSCKLPAKGKGQVYIFNVRLVGPEGSMGPPSDDVQVVVK